MSRMRRVGTRVLNVWKWLADVFSFEWLLAETRRANGGAMILLRTSLITTCVYIVAVSLSQVLDPTRSWHPSFRELELAVRGTISWYGAILAVVYASLYARFASQWVYLANLYNEIKAIEARTAASPSSPAAPTIAEWKAGFLHDALELHLATKPLFLAVVYDWSQEPAIRAHFIRTTPGGEATYARLVRMVRAAMRDYSLPIPSPKEKLGGGDIPPEGTS